VQIEGKCLGPLIDTFHVRDKLRKTVGASRLEFIKVKFVFLAPPDTVEK
jgi:hypothetical protein